MSARDIALYQPVSFDSTHQGGSYTVSGSGAYVSTATYETDPQSDTPQIITFYYTPEKIAVTGQKTWVDNSDAELKRPQDLNLTLLQNGTPMSPQPAYTWVKSGDTWDYTYLNLPAANAGQAYRYTVTEEIPPLYLAEYANKTTLDGTDIKNTLDGGATSFAISKTWQDSKDPVSLFDPRPVNLEVTLYRKGHLDSDFLPLDPQPDIIWVKTDNTPPVPDVWNYTYTGLKQYEAGYPVLYKAVETIPSGYEKVGDDGQNFTNKVIETTATKVWENGPESKPDIWFRLYRQSAAMAAPEVVPNASIKLLQSGTTTATWLGLAQTDASGNPYTFTVREVNAGGDTAFEPLNYKKEESGLTITNRYVIPNDGRATGTKTWVNGAAAHPDVWLQLWRKTADGAIDEAVPGALVIKAKTTGNTMNEWTGLETTDLLGRPYTFYLREGQWDGAAFTEGTPLDYALTGEGTLNLTNTYVIPAQGTALAAKVWSDGENAVKPDVYFRLMRRHAGSNDLFVPVPEAEIKQVPATAPYEVSWTNLQQTDSQARAYEFAVVEGTYDGTAFLEGSPAPFVLTSGSGTLTLNNTYVSPKRADIVLTKSWATEGSGEAPYEDVVLELWRSSSAEAAHMVGSAPLDGDIDLLEYYDWKARFTGLDENDKQGNPYTYEVREPNVPGNYTAEFDQTAFTVTNTWQTVSYTVNKVWEGGYAGMEHPSAQLQLWRQSDTTPLEKVPQIGLVSLPAGAVGDPVTQSHTWNDLPERDSFNNPYTYSVSETRLIGYTPAGPVAANGVDTLTNTYEHVDIDATKVILVPEGTMPAGVGFTFLLTRSDGVTASVRLDGAADTVVPDGSGETAATTDTNGNINWHYSWKYLPKYDAAGNPFTYTVTEPSPPSGFVRLSTLGNMEDGFAITNEYRRNTFRAFKYWNTQDGTAPVTFRLIQWLLNPDGTVAAPGYPDTGGVDMNMNLDLNGVADDQEAPVPNTAAYFEDTPWRAVWTNLPTEVNGQSVKYTVKEVVTAAFAEQFDSVTSASTVITNTSLYTNITGTKAWVNGDPDNRPEATFTLRRYRVSGTTETEDPEFAPLTGQVDGTADAGETSPWTYTFADLPRFYDDNGTQKAYVYKVSEETPPLNYILTGTEASADKTAYTLTNTYVPPTRVIKAAKVWDGGATRPTVTFRLQVRYAGETAESAWQSANPSAVGKNLDGVPETGPDSTSGAQEYAPWKMQGTVPMTDMDGRALEYRVIETGQVPGYDLPEYTSNRTLDGETVDFVVTNTYLIPETGTANATKDFLNGSEANKPDVYFQLWRKTTAGTPEVDEAVPGLDPVNITLMAGYTAAFTGLQTTTFDARPYTFYVKEGVLEGGVFVPKNAIGSFVYDSGEGSLSLANRYVSPQTVTATATKAWVNGPLENRTAVELVLYRKTASGMDEAVPAADLPGSSPVIAGAAPSFTYTWSGLKDTDPEGNPYTYYAREADENAGQTAVGDDAYRVDYSETPETHTTAITNTYLPPMNKSFTATKTWANGPAGNQLPITLNLHRKVTVNGETLSDEQVPAPQGMLTMGGQAPEFTYTWTGLKARDDLGRDYTYYITEPGAPEGGSLVIGGSTYLVTYDADKTAVTNTFQVQMDQTVQVSKTWENGPLTRPTIWLRLMRRMDATSAWTAMPETEMPQGQTAIVELNGEPGHTWTGLPQTDLDGNTWHYAAQEGLLTSGVFTARAPEHYSVMGQNSLSLLNRYVIPRDSETALKIWVNGPATKPDIWLKLERSLDGVSFSDIPSLAPLFLPGGTASVTFQNVEQTDVNGAPYVFRVIEGSFDGAAFVPGTPENYLVKPLSEGLGIENTYVSPSVSKTAVKTWSGSGPVPYPDIYFQLQRRSSAAMSWQPVSDDEVPVKPVPQPLGGATTAEVVWDEVDEFDINGIAYAYRVVEGSLDSLTGVFTPGAPTNYGKNEVGLNVYNTWLITSRSVEKIWEGEPSPAYNLPARTATFELYSRYEGQTAPEMTLVETVILDGIPNDSGTGELTAWKYTWSALPRFDSENRELTYSVKEINVPASYLPGEPVPTADGWSVTNTFEKADLQVQKVYYNTQNRPPVTIVIYRDGAEIHRMELDGIPDAIQTQNMPHETDIGVGTWPSLPKYKADGVTEHVYTVTEIIPAGFPYIRLITKNEPYSFFISNTYSEGTLLAQKIWDLGTAGTADSVTFELWREATDQNGNKTYSRMGENNADATYDGILDGTPDTAWGAHGMETKAWEYTWRNLPLNGDSNNDPTQPVAYRYFARERTVPGGFVIDTTTSSSLRIENVATLVPITAEKVWGGEPAQEGAWFQLFRTASGVSEEAVGDIVHLDGSPDSLDGSGELKAWAYTWAGMPRFADMRDADGNTVPDLNNPYTYYVKETDSAGTVGAPSGYTAYGNGTLKIVNVQSGDITANKTWIGGETQREKGVGPEVYFTLTRRTIDQTEADALTVPTADLGTQQATRVVALWDTDDSPNTVSLTWNNLPLSTPEGVTYVYAVVETDSAGVKVVTWKDAETPEQYIYKVENSETDDLAVSNTYESPSYEVSANKYWHGLTEGDVTPDIWLKLYRGLRDNDQTALSETDFAPWHLRGGSYSASAAYTHSWTVDKFDASGALYVYTTAEFSSPDAAVPQEPEGFENIPKGMDQHNIKLIDVVVTKTWANIPDNAVLPDLTFQLKAGNEVIRTGEPVKGLPAGNSHTFVGLPSVQLDADMNATPVVYTADEANVPDGYTKSVSGLTITNTYDGVSTDDGDDTNDTPITVTVKKAWQDAAGTALTSNLPASLAIFLTGGEALLSGTLTSVDSWTKEFTNLKKFGTDGLPFVYAASETIPDGYKLISSVQSPDYTFTLTNKYDGVSTDDGDDTNDTPITVTVTKLWQDALGNALTNNLPASLAISLTGGEAPLSGTLDSASSWSIEFANLKKFGTDSLPFVYAASETVPDGYKLISSVQSPDYTFTLINKYDGISTDDGDDTNDMPITVTVKKAWQDAAGNTLTSNLPASLAISLTGGEAPLSASLTSTDSWTKEFTNLKKFGTDGLPFLYVASETVPDGYKLISNVQSPNYTFTLTNKYDGVSTDDGDDTNDAPLTITAKKAWSYPDGVTAPADADKPGVTFDLLRNSDELMGERSPQPSGWEVSWDGLYRFDTTGKAYNYTAQETAVPEGYTETVTGSALTGFTVTNTYDGKDTEGNLARVQVGKTWLDENGKALTDAAKLPETLDITLAGNDGTIHEFVLSAKGQWTDTFEVYKVSTAGEHITYTLTEHEPLGYEQLPQSGDQTAGFMLTNRYDGKDDQGRLLDISVLKTWLDENGAGITDNQILPASLVITLTGDDGKSYEHSLTPDETGAWAYTMTGLPKISTRGEAIAYTLGETLPEGYEAAETSGDQAAGFKLTNRRINALPQEEEAKSPMVHFNVGDTVE